ncbi:hypothetical protein B0H16DRAFT_1894275 [Mycena metata]|uniref:Uncharacterized protein n=1 Tax=Mycena metata TaxID=1033252 RepID=A0AAD7HV11_9AGAR|nr:hypothetical protein B0H16DRAFT_1894275 [Mycena metata]
MVWIVPPPPLSSTRRLAQRGSPSTSTLSRLRARSTPSLLKTLKLLKNLKPPSSSSTLKTSAVAVAVVNIFRTVRSRPQWDTDGQALKTSSALFKTLSPLRRRRRRQSSRPSSSLKSQNLSGILSSRSSLQVPKSQGASSPSSPQDDQAEVVKSLKFQALKILQDLGGKPLKNIKEARRRASSVLKPSPG